MDKHVAVVYCPAVPTPHNGTAGQCEAGTNSSPAESGTASGTVGGTVSLKALAQRLLERDIARDSNENRQGRIGLKPEVSGVPPSSRLKMGQRDSLPGCHALDLGTLPEAACLSCGTDIWWRLSVLSGGPSPWRCIGCTPPDPVDWIDGYAIPIGHAR